MNGVLLVVLDGVGVNRDYEGNAFTRADTPVLDRLFENCSYTELEAYGPAVGLPDGYIGNSEVGHLHIGAGRVIPQELVRVNESIEDGSFFENRVLQEASGLASERGSRVHVMGIASDGGVHGHVDHMLAAVDFFSQEGVDVIVHAFLDGRDVGPESAERFLERIEEEAVGRDGVKLGSFMGRYYAMDRDLNWDRTREAYTALVHGDGRRVQNIEEGMEMARERDRNDYFVRPTLLPGFSPVKENDVVLFTNYRKDRARQLTRAFIDPSFGEFETEDPEHFHFVSLYRYKDDFDNPFIFEEIIVENTLGEVISRAGLKQLRLTESQKEPHVTYFLNGQREREFEGEDVMVHRSADVPSYDEKPEMEAGTITDSAVEALESREYGFIFINYPNADLVGHTGDVGAAVEAVETLDRCVKGLEEACLENDYVLVITSDHGTCEEMLKDGEMQTSHTLNDVPFCVVNGDRDLERGGLANIAPTVLEMLGIEAPPEMIESLAP